MEAEIKFHLTPDASMSGETLFAELSALRSLGGCTLGPPRSLSIRGIYFDTPDRRRKAGNAALRLACRTGRDSSR